MIYSTYKVSILTPLLGQTIKAALMTSAYMISSDQEFFSDISEYEAEAPGYTAGGQTLTNVVLAASGLSIFLDADDPEWITSGTLTAKAIVYYIDSGDEETSRLLSVYSFPIERSAINGSFKVELPLKGFISMQ